MNDLTYANQVISANTPHQLEDTPRQGESQEQVLVALPMGQRELAKRLGLRSHSQLSYRRLKLDFLEWSRERDPDGIGWRFDPESKLFYPQK